MMTAVVVDTLALLEGQTTAACRTKERSAQIRMTLPQIEGSTCTQQQQQQQQQ